jgi:hypothetical protein
LAFLTLNDPRTVVPTQTEPLNNLLPEGGLVPGSFVEILSAQEGSGAFSLALALAQPLLTRREAWAVVDSENAFYPPAATALGFDLKRLILLRPTLDDEAWAFTQLLRSRDISVCFWTTSRMDNMLFRRLQLAAEQSEGVGFVMRPAAAERRPSWANIRLMASWRSCGSGCKSGLRLCARVLHAAGRFVDSAHEVEVPL